MSKKSLCVRKKNKRKRRKQLLSFRLKSKFEVHLYGCLSLNNMTDQSSKIYIMYQWIVKKPKAAIWLNDHPHGWCDLVSSQSAHQHSANCRRFVRFVLNHSRNKRQRKGRTSRSLTFAIAFPLTQTSRDKLDQHLLWGESNKFFFFLSLK